MLSPAALLVSVLVVSAAPPVAAPATAPATTLVDPAGRPWRVPGAPCDGPEACQTSCTQGVPESCAWFNAGPQRFLDVKRCKEGDAATCGRFRATQGSVLIPWATQRLTALCGAKDVEACRLLFAGPTALPGPEHATAAIELAGKLQPQCAGDAKACLAFGHACGVVPTCEALCARGYDGACVEALAIPDVPTPQAMAQLRTLCARDVAACVVLVRWAGDLKTSDRAASAEADKAGWGGLTAACNDARKDGCAAALDAWATWETRPPEALLQQSLSKLVVHCARGDDSACIELASNRRNAGSAAQHDVVGGRLAPRCDDGSDAACEALLFAGGLIDGGPKKAQAGARARGLRAFDALTGRCLGGQEPACAMLERATTPADDAGRTASLDHALCVRGRTARCMVEPQSERCAAGELVACEGLVGLDVAAAQAGLLSSCHGGDPAACARAATLALVGPGRTAQPQQVEALKARACSLGAADQCAVKPPPSAPPVTKLPPLPKGAVVEVLWKGEWYKATVLDVKYQSYRVHYAGYAATYDEWVAEDRVRTLPRTP